ncbi:MAG: dynamin family protein [Deltaproteobacteria bacterium]|nr:dynamin family protein [Candidatus Anaeroferrophillus wilburensis]MBN2889956.1 dynamin family protein [Deltaproteobacteria bacterium]
MLSDAANKQLAGLRHCLTTLKDTLRSMAVSMPDKHQRVDKWTATTNELLHLTSQFTLPITVIGPIKSGKSTLLNMLIGQPLLPMGAGITTTFLTTVSHGQLQGEITLIPPDQINTLFQNSCYYLLGEELEDAAISLFTAEHRQHIETLLQNYSRTTTVTRYGSFNEHYRQLKNLLAAFATINSYYEAEQLSKTFTPDQLPQFTSFITNEPLSTYLEQAHLTCPFSSFPEYVVLQDCQGLDTPSPGQQAVAIQQLASSPLLIYVISSRMGLRQADYYLFEHLRQLGLDTRLFFVLNCDFMEHQSVDNMNAILKRCEEELAELGFSQPCYAFSALYHLYDQQRQASSLGKVEEQRWALWQEETAKKAQSSAARETFLRHLHEIVSQEASQSLTHHLNSRITHIATQSQALVRARKQLIANHRQEIGATVDDYEESREQLAQVEEQLTSTLTTITLQLEKEYFKKTESWFSKNSSESIITALEDIINNYETPKDLLPDKTKNPLLPVKILERHFQQSVHQRLQEKLEITVRQQWSGMEKKLNTAVDEQCAPLFFLLEKATGRTISHQEQQNLPAPINWVATMPSFSFTLPITERFAAVAKISLVGKILLDKIRRLRKKSSWSESIRAQLQDHAKEELKGRLLDYQEQIKFLFLRPYLQKYAQLLKDFFTDFLHLSTTDMARKQDGLLEENLHQEELLAILNDLDHQLQRILAELPHAVSQSSS